MAHHRTGGMGTLPGFGGELAGQGRGGRRSVLICMNASSHSNMKPEDLSLCRFRIIYLGIRDA